MGTPAAYLPPALSTESIIELTATLGLPTPTKIDALRVLAEYHSIYLLRYEGPGAREVPARADPDGSVTLVLRVSGRHLPRVKTLNEVGVMAWVRQSTSIPVPAVVRFSASEDNPIGHEFTLLEKAPGASLDGLYDTLTEAAKRRVVEQLADFLIELHAKPWVPGHVGGLVLEQQQQQQHRDDGTTTICPGPPLEETFWQAPDVEKYWPGETIASLNPLDGPYASYTAYVRAALGCYIHAVETHPSLARFRELSAGTGAGADADTLLARMRRFARALEDPSSPHLAALDDVTYVLAHKDLHFANVMCELDRSGEEGEGGGEGEEDTAVLLPRITAVLDWEFSGVVPAPRWNPVRAFLWNGGRDAEAKEERARMEALFEAVCVEKGAALLLEEMRPNALQESMQTAINHIRAIVEVCPRGEAQDKVEGWREVAEAAMEVFF